MDDSGKLVQERRYILLENTILRTCLPVFLALLFIIVSTDPVSARNSDTPEIHLQRALEYSQSGDLARARIEYETVLQIDNLPTDPNQIDQIYAKEARSRLAGQRIIPSAYIMVSAGNYREKATIAGAGDGDDLFGGVRLGGRLAVTTSDKFSVNASLDYRFRAYDNAVRRYDSDLRWNLSGNHILGNNNLDFGIRGWSSYRGNGITRNDYGIFSALRFPVSENDQLKIGAELARRHYPRGPLRERSRDIAEASASWTHAMGKMSFSLAAHGGREFATSDRPGGDSNFFGVSPSFDVAISDKVGAFTYLWWIEFDSGDTGAAIGTRNDDLLEIGGGVTWSFSPGWEAGPSFIYLRDFSNIVAVNYSSIEFILSVRRDF